MAGSRSTRPGQCGLWRWRFAASDWWPSRSGTSRLNTAGSILGPVPSPSGMANSRSRLPGSRGGLRGRGRAFATGSFAPVGRWFEPRWVRLSCPKGAEPVTLRPPGRGDADGDPGTGDAVTVALNQANRGVRRDPRDSLATRKGWPTRGRLGENGGGGCGEGARVRTPTLTQGEPPKVARETPGLCPGSRWHSPVESSSQRGQAEVQGVGDR